MLLALAGFSSVAMLGWAGAALIPIILHLLKRRRQSSIPWAAMELLRQVIQQESRRAHLRQLLLVAIRVAILLTLAMALARPFWTSSLSAIDFAATRPNKLSILIVDTSYSMGYRSGELTRMERARQRVANLVRESQTGDAFALIAMDAPSRLVIGKPTFDGQALLTEMGGLTETARGGDLLSSLKLASHIVAEATSPERASDFNMPQAVEILILSDLGIDSWQSAIDGPAEKLLSRLSQQYPVTLESMVESKPINVAIESVRPSSLRATVGVPMVVDVTIASFGASQTEIPVQLELDGRTLGRTTVELAAGQRQTTQFTITPQQSGTSILSVVTPADNLPIDNRYDLVLDVKQGHRILIVDSRSRSTSESSATKQLNPWRLALQPETTDNSPSRSREIRVISDLSWLATPMQEWDVVIVNDPVWTSPDQVARLTSYVASGGSAILALGRNHSSQVSLETLLGIKTLGVSESSDWEIDPLDFRSPVVKAFEEFPNSGLLTTPIFRFWRTLLLDSPPGQETTVDLATTNGDTLIVRKKLGSGMIACLTTAPEDGRDQPGHESWNAIIAWPSFLPLAQQLVQSVLNVDSRQANRLAGESLSGTLSSSLSVDTITLERPDQSAVQITRGSPDDSGRSTWNYSATDLRGIYRITQPAQAAQDFAINIDPRQSSLESIQQESILAIHASPQQVAVTQAGGAPPSPSEYFSRWLLVLLGVLLLGESLVAWTLGRRIA